MSRKIDLSGQKFGKLTALKDVGRTNSGNILWECLCECGRTHIVAQGNLRYGNTKSCGCAERTGTWHYNNLTGKTFGRLTVLSIDHKSNHGMYWKCRCSCGNFTVVRSDGLVTGNTKSCGCLMLDMSKNKAKQLFTKHGLSGTREYTNYKSAKRRELSNLHDSELTLELELALKEFFPSCVLCGSTENLSKEHVLPLSKGYGLKPGNAVITCKSCNSSKNDKYITELPLEWQVNLIWNAFRFKDYWEKRAAT